MKQALQFSRSLETGTKIILYLGMILTVVLSVVGFIIAHFYADFNINLLFFSGDDMMRGGRAFFVCTLVAAVIAEACLKRVHNEEK